VTQLVIPSADSFRARVNHTTPLSALVAELRRLNPRAPYGQLKATAEAMRRGEVSMEDAPRRFDSDADSGAPHRTPDAPESEVEDHGSAPTTSAPDADAQALVDLHAVAQIAEARERYLAEHKPDRAAVEAWVARQRGGAKGLSMSKSGRIPTAVLTAYRKAHRDEILASMVAVEGGGEPMPADVPLGSPYEVH